jgi:hypothetical protein
MTSATTVTGVYPAVRRKSGSFKSITDTVTPNFRERVKNGEVILNNVTLVRDTRACTESSWRAGNHPTWGTRTFEGSIACEHHVTLATPSGYATDVTNASANVLIEAYAKMNAVDVQSLVSVAELGKTLEMLHHPLAKANDLVNKMIILKKAKFENPRYNLLKAYLKRYPTRTAKEVGDAITSAYLEYRYGLKPLMYDVAGIVKNVTTARPSPKTLYVARAGLSLSKRVTAPNTYLGIPGTTDSQATARSFSLIASLLACFTTSQISQRRTIRNDPWVSTFGACLLPLMSYCLIHLCWTGSSSWGLGYKLYCQIPP